MVIISGIVCVYYNIIITWTIYFLYHSFRAVLPWSTCDNSWNTDNCYIRGESTLTNATANGTIGYNVTQLNTTSLSSVPSVALNLVNGTSNVTKSDLSNKVTASEEFWQWVSLLLQLICRKYFIILSIEANTPPVLSSLVCVCVKGNHLLEFKGENLSLGQVLLIRSNSKLSI